MSKTEVADVPEALDALEQEGVVTSSAANTLRMLLFTGARSGEIKNAKWSWVDWHNQVIDLPDSKTGPKPLYLSKQAIAVLRAQQALELESEYAFPSRQLAKPIVNLRKPWLRVCERAGLENVRIHDLRHTAASVAIGAGASLAIVGKLLGHTQAQTNFAICSFGRRPRAESC